MSVHGQQRATIYALASVLCWSTVATAFKLALEDLSVPALVLYSTLASALILTLIVLSGQRRSGIAALTLRDVLPSAVMGLLNPFAYYLVLFRAYDLLPAQEAQPLNYTWPIVLSVLAALFMQQRLTWRDGLAMLISFSGVLLISTRGAILELRFTSLEGVGLAVGSSLIWASYWILNMRSGIDPVLRLALNFIAGSVYIAVFMLVTGEPAAVSWRGIAAAAYIGTFEMGLTFVLWMGALRYAENTARISNLVFLSPFLSLIVIAAVLGETIYLSTIAGLLFIVGGILVQQLGRRHQPHA